MKKLWILLVVAFVISLVGSVSAFEGFPTWYASEITAANPITIDASLADWSWVDPATIITSDDLQDCLGGELPPKDDFDCVLYVGWSRSENMIYVGTQVMDDIFNNDCPEPGQAYMDDNLEIIIDANNDGGNYRGVPVGGPAQQTAFHIPGAGGFQAYYHWAPEEMQWITHEPWAILAYDDSNVPDVYIYEIKIAIWDNVDPTGPDNSERHICTADETIGFQLQYDEVDAEPDTRDHQPCTGTTESGASWNDASVISNFVLLPSPDVAVQASSWGSVKALMK